MRRAGVLPDRESADRFRDYLDTIGVSSEIRDASLAGGEVELFIYEEDQVEQGRAELAAFRADPQADRFARAAAEAASVREAQRQSKIDAEKARLLARSRRLEPWWRRVPGLFAIMLACLGFGVATQFGTENPRLLNGLRITEADPPAVVNGEGGTIEPAPNQPRLPEVRDGEIWRLVTPIFRHAGATHLLTNLVGLFVFGQMIERRRGTPLLLLLVLTLAVVTSLVQFELTGPDFGGISGVVCGLFGYATVKSLLQPRLGLFVPQEIAAMFVMYLLVCLTQPDQFANGAHFSGLLAGAGISLIGVLSSRMSGSPDAAADASDADETASV